MNKISDKNILTIDECSRLYPNKIAVQFDNKSLNYATFYQNVIRCSHYLMLFGVKKEDYVIIHMYNSIDMIVYIYSLMAIGAVAVPINVEFEESAIKRIIDKFDINYILSDRQIYMPNIVQIPLMNDDTCYDINPNCSIKFDFTSKEAAFCYLTSGSTSSANAVMLSYQGIYNHCKSKIKLLGLTCKSRVALSLKIGFVASLWQVIAPLCIGATLVILKNEIIKNPQKLFSNIHDQRVSDFSVIPQYLQLYCGQIYDKNEISLQYVKHIILTGEKVYASNIFQFMDMYPNIQLVNAYGQSECSDDTFHYFINKNTDFQNIPIGKPIDNIKWCILDDEKREQMKGELYISGQCLSLGYRNNRNLTEQRFVYIKQYNDMFFKTGDIVSLNGENDMLFWGRVDNQIKIRGIKIELEDIEKYINSYPDITRSIVMVLSNDIGEKWIRAIYQSKYNEKISITSLKSYLSEYMPPYMIPKEYILVKEFNYNANGKINRLNPIKE